MSKYVVIEVRNTMDLVSWGRLEFGVCTPIEEYEAVQKGVKIKKREPAAPGYAFVPFDNFYEFRRRVPSKYNMRPLGYDRAGRLKCCEEHEFDRMQTLLDEQPCAQEEIKFSKGQRVQAVAGWLLGNEGVVQRKGTSRAVRLLMGTKYVTYPKKWLVHV